MLARYTAKVRAILGDIAADVRADQCKSPAVMQLGDALFAWLTDVADLERRAALQPPAMGGRPNASDRWLASMMEPARGGSMQSDLPGDSDDDANIEISDAGSAYDDDDWGSYSDFGND